ncbi:TonB-dependent receptor [Geomonas sp. RF6]|uniref:TonB-dependent receptor plug domain-containing protein n=1 Tax=Geomonas sp. RF6 TaxID=2897342 RepID=UPI001E4F1941|nr:TonB-dependent receptor [Geomonas sp. RF6]UFS70608.1 TonB-dependent receptor [Geomonas sp. RF6]
MKQNKKRVTRTFLPLLFTLLACVALPFGAHAADTDQGSQPLDLTSLKLEDLMDLTVTSVGRKAQKIYDSAAAVFVITQEDIRRSGVTNIPDALRMVPGLEVARIDGNKWAVSSRGFNGRFASKMLVLMDGRSVYTPLFSGVLWDSQDTLMEDIARIEVVRGPGATMWGANAVNGIINIITKEAEDTVGGLVTAGGGTQERAFASARYGKQLGEKGNYRVYLKYFDREGLEDPQTGREGHNGWHALRGGFRLDAAPAEKDTFTLQGDYYDQRLNETYLNIPGFGDTLNYTTPVSGGNLIARWKRTFSESADMGVQLYYDRTDMRYAVVDASIDTVDVDFQNRFRFGSEHEILWGAGYRFIRDRLRFPLQDFTLKEREQNNLFSAFLQGTFMLVPERLHLIVGSKFEHNDYTGLEVQPSARLLWTPAEKQSVWLSVSRAARTPSLGEDSESLSIAAPPTSIPPFPEPVPTHVHMIGSDTLKAEKLIAYELGYRVEPVPRLTVDTALFYNVYRDLILLRADAPIFSFAPAPALTIPAQLQSRSAAKTWGGELAGDLKALPWWRLRLAYTFLRVLSQETDPAILAADLKKENPQHQVSLRSAMDLGKNVEGDLWLRYVDALPAFGIASYLTLDARLDWQLRKDLHLVLVGQNLLHDRQMEFVSQYISTQPAALGRSFYGKLQWEF